MNRYMLMGRKNWYRIPGWAVSVALRNRKKAKYHFSENYGFIRNMVKKADRAGKIEVVIKGRENIPKEHGYILFPNHEGFFDALAMFEACEEPIHFVAMKEIMDMPFLKYIFQILEINLMDRDDIRQSFMVINQVTEGVKNKENYVIFAEGYLEEQKNHVQEMKAGAFKSAMNAKSPIVPVALKNTYLPFTQETSGPVKVYVTFLEPIYYEQYQGRNSRQIAEIVREKIQNAIDSTNSY